MKKSISSRLHPLSAVVAALLAGPALGATFTVTNAGDAGDANPGDGVCATAGAVCTLRAAIEEANGLAGADDIQFHIGGGGAVTIAKSGALPDITITSEVHIDGYTQPGASANTLAVGNDAVVQVRYDGSAASGNGLHFTAGSSNSSLRGLILSGHGERAILVDNSAGSTFAGNFIGTDATGANLHNHWGIFMLDDADNHMIGGPNPADRNVVAANLAEGIIIGVSTTSGNTVRNNYIGTAPDGVTALNNGTYGISINSAPATTVRDNVITSSVSAILVSNGAANQTVLLGNSIGVGADGVTVLGGYHGVEVRSGPSGAPHAVWVGGVAAGEGNVIANMAGHGVRVNRGDPAYAYPSAVAIRGNAIHDNTGMGIDLADSATGTGDGVPNPNDADDSDTGANNFQNFPVVISATTDGAGTTVDLTYDAYPVGGFWVDVYSSPTCDANGHGEGRVYLGTATFDTDGTGHASLTVSGLPATTVGHFVTLTATDTLFWSTSEFSTCLAITAAGATPPIMGDVPDQPAIVGASFSLDIAGHVTLTEGDPIVSFTYTGDLPPGLSLNATTGQVSGTPTVVGIWTANFAASDDAGGSNVDSVTFTVAEASGPAGGTMQFSVSAQTVSEAAGSVAVAVTRTGGGSGPVSIAYTTAAGTAATPADFATASGALNWADGDTSPKSFTVAIVDDAATEGDEQFTVVLTDNSPTDTGSLGSPSVQTVTISDDDVALAAEAPQPVPVFGAFGYGLAALLVGLAGVVAQRLQGVSR